MSEPVWRPLGVDEDDQVADYDALHDGVPGWMSAAYWAWVRKSLTEIRRYRDGSGAVPHLNESLAEEMAQTLRIPLMDLRLPGTDSNGGQLQLKGAMQAFSGHMYPLQVADYLLAHGGKSADGAVLEELLTRSKSAWRVGERAGRQGLVSRVPKGVQIVADSVMDRSGRAGVRLARSWEELYGLAPNPSEAYRLSILAVEDAAVPVVSPGNKSATLGTVLKQMEDQGNWRLPMKREHSKAPTQDVLIGMIRLLWHGQHDRHGGQPSGPGDVTFEEASVAVHLATTLVQWFHSGVIARGAVGTD